MNIRTYTLPALLVGTLLASSSAQAASLPSTLQVKVVISGNCTISTEAVDFGNVGTTTSASNAIGKIKANCTNNTPYSIKLGPGNGTGATVDARKMTSGTNTVGYQLRHTSASGPIWGDGTANTSIFNSTGTGAQQAHNVYGVIPVQTHPGNGTFSDTVGVTLEW